MHLFMHHGKGNGTGEHEALVDDSTGSPGERR